MKKIILTLLLAFFSHVAVAIDYTFDGSMTEAVLNNYLSRAINMDRLGHGDVGNTTDNIRMLNILKAKYVGRVILPYGNESKYLSRLASTKTIATQLHESDPEMILEGGVYEYVSAQVNTVPIPAYVFSAFGLTPVTRNFVQADMVTPNNPVMGGDKCPDVTKQETKLWYYYLATSQIDAGLESIHWGWFEPQSYYDKPNYTNYYDVLTRVRRFASAHARRHFVLNNADASTIPAIRTKLLFDFGSGTLGIIGQQMVANNPQDTILTTTHKFGAGVTPSGWSTTNVPFLIHIDNTGLYSTDLTKGMWGKDQISWFAYQDEPYRNEFLVYANDYVKNMWPNGAAHLEIPGIRIITPAMGTNGYYFANSSTSNALGFNQEPTIKTMWGVDTQP